MGSTATKRELGDILFSNKVPINLKYEVKRLTWSYKSSVMFIAKFCLLEKK